MAYGGRVYFSPRFYNQANEINNLLIGSITLKFKTHILKHMNYLT